eukprot:s1453_g8.t1
MPIEEGLDRPASVSPTSEAGVGRVASDIRSSATEPARVSPDQATFVAKHTGHATEIAITGKCLENGSTEAHDSKQLDALKPLGLHSVPLHSVPQVGKCSVDIPHAPEICESKPPHVSSHRSLAEGTNKDVVLGQAKLMHASLFTKTTCPPDMLQPPRDPFLDHDPWIVARNKPEYAIPNAASEATKPAYDRHGGMHQFAAKKRPFEAAHQADSKRLRSAIESHEINSTAIANTDLSSKEESKTHDQVVNTTSSPAAPAPSHVPDPLHKVIVSKGTTVGQLAMAEKQLLDLPDPVRALDAMGAFLPVYTELQPHQIVFFENGSRAHAPKLPEVRHMNRQDALWSQLAWVATDEMAFYLQMIGQPNLSNTTPPLLLTGTEDDSAAFETWLALGIDRKTTESEDVVLHTACLREDHWFPISARFAKDIIHLTTTLPELSLVQQLAEAAFGNVFHFHYKVPHHSLDHHIA